MKYRYLTTVNYELKTHMKQTEAETTDILLYM